MQPNGAYHYHALPLGPVQKLAKPDAMLLVGYATDRFPIENQHGHAEPKDPQSPLRTLESSYRLGRGERPGGVKGPGGKYDGTFNQDFVFVATSGDLDSCNGRFEVTAEYPKGTYHYVITEEFPFVSRLHRGVPDPSFRQVPPPGRGPGGRGGPPGRDSPPPGGRGARE